MSRGHPCWETLGIEPTSDQHAVRSAYAAKLKTIDPDTDPQAFIALREAFEAARFQAQWVDLPDDEDEQDWDEDWDEQDWDSNAPGDGIADYSLVSPITGLPPTPPQQPTLAEGGFPHGSDPRRNARDAAQPQPEAELHPAGFPEGSDPRRDPGMPESEAPSAEVVAHNFPEGSDPRRQPWGPASAEDADAHARAIATLLYAHGDGQTYAAADQKAAMLDHWRAIIADPRMQEIAFFADADRWFGDLIARAIPFSDPLIVPATRFFGWTRSDGSITQSWAAEKITRRYAAIDFMEAVIKPDHPLNKAWRELTRPADEGARRGKVNPRAVGRLLTTVRTHYPDLEGAFDFYRVGLWDGTVENGASKRFPTWIFAVVFGLLIIARLVGGAVDTFNNPPGTTPLVQAETDVGDALERLFDGDLTLAKIATTNPALHKALIGYWQEEKAAKVSRADFAGDLRVFLNRWVQAGVRKADAALLTEFHRIDIDIAKALQVHSVGECRKYLDGTRVANSSGIPGDLIRRTRAMTISVLLLTDGSSADGSRQHRVAGPVIEAAAKRAGQTRDQMGEVMMFKGPDAQLCIGRIAFMETVLALPEKERLPLMRVM